MKRIFASLLAIVITLSAVAQQKTKPAKAHDHQRKMEKGTMPGHKFQPKQLIGKLNLTEDQKTRLKTVNENFKDQLKELNKNETITVKELREKREALAKQHRAEVEALLTPEQRKELEKQKKEARSKVAGFKRLDLTSEQSEKLKVINQDYKSNAQAIQKNSTLTPQEKKERLNALQSKHSEAIKAILTEEQREKLEDLKKNHGNRKVK